MSLSAIRRAALLCGACMAVLGGGCGEESDEGAQPRSGDSSASTAAPAAGQPPANRATDEDQVKAVVTGMYRDVAAGDAAGVCSAMSDAARTQIAQNVPGGSPDAPSDRTCEASFSAFLRAAATSGTLQRTADARVEKVVIRDGKATATVSFGGAGGPLRLLKEDGAWKVGDATVSPSG